MFDNADKALDDPVTQSHQLKRLHGYGGQVQVGSLYCHLRVVWNHWFMGVVAVTDGRARLTDQMVLKYDSKLALCYRSPAETLVYILICSERHNQTVYETPI